MDWRLFASTFALVFLAELGDKTQLASMALSAGSKSPASVFVGAAGALVLSALLAVVLGTTLQRYINPKYLQIGASVLFLAFGTVLLITALGKKTEASVPPPTLEEAVGPVARLVLRAALEFEKTSSTDYRRLARESDSPALRDLFLHLAEEEEEHAAHIDKLSGIHAKQSWGVGEHPTAPQTPAAASGSETQRPDVILQSAIEHERSTARFYRTLAQTAPLPSIKTALLRMAAEEDSHVAHLDEMARHGRTEIS